MKRLLICMRCGHEGYDVEAKVVDLEAEAKAEGQRVRTVEVELVHELRHVRETTKVVVPERFGTEHRCRSAFECDQRYAALQAEQQATTRTEEDVPWL